MCPFLHSSNMPCTQKLNNIQHPNKTLTHAHRHSEQNLRERGKERERRKERESVCVCVREREGRVGERVSRRGPIQYLLRTFCSNRL